MKPLEKAFTNHIQRNSAKFLAVALGRVKLGVVTLTPNPKVFVCLLVCFWQVQFHQLYDLLCRSWGSLKLFE